MPNGLDGAVRAHQRDLIHVSSLKEQTDNILRSWFGEHPLFPGMVRIISHIIDAPYVQEHAG
jgi:hypothetical protein